MPIKGLTDRVTPRFPSLGKLRKGGPKPENSKAPGPDLDYFRFTSDRKEVEFAFQQLFPAPKGKPAPDVIESVYLPYKTLDENFTAWKEHWVAGGLKHRCDGETMNLWQDEAGKYHTGSKPCPGGCKEVGRLTMIIPALIKAGFVGYVTLETHSLHDIMSIQSCLMAIAEARGNNQMGLQGIPLLLRRVPEKISTPGKDGRVRRIKSLVKVEPIATWKPLQLMMVEKMEALPEPAPLALDEPELRELPEPKQDDQDAGAENDDADDFVEGKDEIIPDAEYTEEPEDDSLAAQAFEMRERAPKRLAKDTTTMTPITDKQKGLLASLVNQATGKSNGNGEQDRHLLMEYLWDKQRLAELTFGEARESIDWLIDASKAPAEYVCKPTSAELAKRMIAAQLKAQGQTELAL